MAVDHVPRNFRQQRGVVGWRQKFFVGAIPRGARNVVLAMKCQASSTGTNFMPSRKQSMRLSTRSVVRRGGRGYVGTSESLAGCILERRRSLARPTHTTKCDLRYFFRSCCVRVQKVSAGGFARSHPGSTDSLHARRKRSNTFRRRRAVGIDGTPWPKAHHSFRDRM